MVPSGLGRECERRLALHRRCEQVPKDRPLHALDMIERYLAGAGYDTVAQPRGTGPGGPTEPPPLCGE